MPSNATSGESLLGRLTSAFDGSPVLAAGLWTLVAAVGVAAAQSEFTNSPTIGPLARLSLSVVSFLFVGGLTLAASPGYAARVEDRIRSTPGRSFLWGVGVFVGFVGSIFVLAITQIGIVLAIPLAILFIVVGTVGNVLAYLAATRSVLDGRLLPLVAGAVLSGLVVSIPVVGDILGFVVGSVGVGGVALEYRS